jgi:hypothetical protein
MVADGPRQEEASMLCSRSIDTDGAGAASKKKAESIYFPAFLTIAS